MFVPERVFSRELRYEMISKASLKADSTYLQFSLFYVCAHTQGCRLRIEIYILFIDGKGSGYHLARQITDHQILNKSRAPFEIGSTKQPDLPQLWHLVSIPVVDLE